ncbi:beta-lactamase/transpeptidase-like protein [Aspergillus avenaceus]|uniref:hydroxymethylglutaryl-CoA lyase n=1 Tax=Aspergillus avenaceus TaxID=36643 RepID=A0A5N6TP00_ASPAV|nr:beta-lactamase/transpeptidase-like protein [Aspergillus avenaceus]
MKDPRSAVRIVEVGPRDGLQNIKDHIPTSIKLDLIRRLRATGLRAIELTSVVSPRAVPQLADCRDVLGTEDIKFMQDDGKLRFPVLVPNMKGLDIALQHDVKEIAVFISATEGFSKANINCSVKEGLARARSVAEKAIQCGLAVRGYVSCIFSDPFDGPTPPSAVLPCVKELLDMGCYEVSLGDTLGVGCPRRVRELLIYLKENGIPLNVLAGHFHDTYGQAVANVWEAYNCGLRVFDSSISGLGGCPYAPGAKGNVATEDLAYMFHNAGIDTGIDMPKLVETGFWISKELSRENSSRAGTALANKYGLTSPPTTRDSTSPKLVWSPVKDKGKVLTYRAGKNFKAVLNRPKKGNILTKSMMTELAANIEKCNDDPSLSNIIITATGKFFCMGVDFGKNVSLVPQTPSGDTKVQCLTTLVERINRSPKTTIACINGAAFGGGVGLALACDLAIGVKTATLTVGEARFKQAGNVGSGWNSALVRSAIFSTRCATAEQLSSVGVVADTADDKQQLESSLDDLLIRLTNSIPAKPRASKEFARLTRANLADTQMYRWSAYFRLIQSTYVISLSIDMHRVINMVIRTINSPFTSDFDSLVQEQLDKWKVPGIAISIIHGSSTYSKAYGIAEFPGKRMTTQSLFPAFSTTKAFTAAAVSLAIDDSKGTSSPLTWETPVASLIRDDFVLADDHATMNTTLEDALSHRSGLPGHEGAMALASPTETLRDAVRKMRHLPLAYAPRTTFGYCNHMYMAVSHALQQTQGEPLGDILKRRIWNPLGMDDTYFSIQKVQNSPSLNQRLVRGYTWVAERGTYVAEAQINYPPTTGTGAIVSNVLDYARWLRAMMYQTDPVSPEGHAALVRPRTILFNDDPDTIAPPGSFHLYALGWFVETYRGHQLYWHSGSWPGFGIMVGFVPKKHFGFAMMGNTTNARQAELELYLYLLDTLLGVSDNVRAEFVAKMTEKMEKIMRTNSETIDQAKRRLFPSLPDRPIPPSLSLDRYTGTYCHPGYGMITVKIIDGQLQSDLRDRVGGIFIQLTHATGEFFVAKASTDSTTLFYRGEFYVDSFGVARKFGMDLEPALRGEKTWFERRI